MKGDAIDVDAHDRRERWNRRRTALGRLAQAALGVRPVPTGGEFTDRWWR